MPCPVRTGWAGSVEGLTVRSGNGRLLCALILVSNKMKVFVPKETAPHETRAALLPEHVRKLRGLGLDVIVESGLGARIPVADADYEQAGASIMADRRAGYREADIVLRVQSSMVDEIAAMKSGALHVSFLDPFQRRELVDAFAAAGVTALSMELIPRTTVAQKMDALSSQASLAGYVAVILAAERLNRIFPMMMTPAGTITPARVLVIGAGVAGLQAIATARRLGARVEAYDVRPEVEEQVRSLGARFLKIGVQAESTRDGYARELTPEQLEKQRQELKRFCSQADVLITTAQVFGKRAPLIITAEMVQAMKPASVVVDLAVENGGNVEGIQPGAEVERNGVRLLGFYNLPGRVPFHATQMYGSNLAALVEHLWNREKNAPEVNLEDPIVGRCVVTHGGSVVNPLLKGGNRP